MKKLIVTSLIALFAVGFVSAQQPVAKKETKKEEVKNKKEEKKADKKSEKKEAKPTKKKEAKK